MLSQILAAIFRRFIVAPYLISRTPKTPAGRLTTLLSAGCGPGFSLCENTLKSRRSMFSLVIETDPEHRDLLVAELWEEGSAGIVELDDYHLRAFFEEAVDREGLLRRYPDAIPRTEELHDWVGTARELLQPMTVGARFFLAPEWRDDPAPPGRFRIVINPGLAFGTGVHETTQLCLEALEDHVKAGIAVLDVGTGSGILAQAARLLGAGHVIACDADPVAIEIARERVENVFAGSVDAVCSHAFDLVVANISPEVIVQLAPDLLRALRVGGILLASGFERNEAGVVRQALGAVTETRFKGNWALSVTRCN
ncbi:MAG: hypothetical protein C5B51_25310 [Terriglobia bacterium]|nr:MAG: hypothetical protein C5B51_25310 [Terriglobia bacterium]